MCLFSLNGRLDFQGKNGERSCSGIDWLTGDVEVPDATPFSHCLLLVRPDMTGYLIIDSNKHYHFSILVDGHGQKNSRSSTI